MSKIKYLIKRIFSLDYKQFFKTIDKINKKTKISKIKLFFDIIYCGIKYQAGYIDYELFQMYDMNSKERKTILTRGKNNAYVKMLNPKEYWHIFDNKDEFDERFKKYLNREFMVINESNKDEFKKFINNKDEIIVKPLSESCGKGIEKIELKNINKDELYTKLLSNKQFLVEEVAHQHKDLAKLHKESINTIRVVTLKNKYNVTTIITAIIRIGTNKEIVDNFNHGGVCSVVDLKTGKILTPAIDKQGNTYEYHPTTKIKLVGYQLPNWDKVIKLVKEAAKEVKEMNLIGWDVCIGEEKPLLIEANQFPGHDLYQLPAHRINNNKYGMVPIFEEALNKKVGE